MLTLSESLTIASISLTIILTVSLYIIDQHRKKREWLRDVLQSIHKKHWNIINETQNISFKEPLNYVSSMDHFLLNELFKYYKNNEYSKIVSVLKTHIQRYFNHISIRFSGVWTQMANEEALSLRGHFGRLTETLFYLFKLYRDIKPRNESVIEYIVTYLLHIWSNEGEKASETMFSSTMKQAIITVFALYYNLLSNLIMQMGTMSDVICIPYSTMRTLLDFIKAKRLEFKIKQIQKRVDIDFFNYRTIINYLSVIIKTYNKLYNINALLLTEYDITLKYLYISYYLHEKSSERLYDTMQTVWYYIIEDRSFNINNLYWANPKVALDEAQERVNDKNWLFEVLLT